MKKSKQVVLTVACLAAGLALVASIPFWGLIFKKGE